MNIKVVILSKNPQNALDCVESVLKAESCLKQQDIIIVDDGAKDVAGMLLRDIDWVAGVKPFIFARNANLGINHAFEHGADGVVLMNDDATLLTEKGFTRLAKAGRAMGITSPAVRGSVGNPNQNSQPSVIVPLLRLEPKRICFVCVFIPKSTWEDVGQLDEQFVGYGYEDDDYSRRVKEAGMELAIFEGCLVEHGKRPSQFRSTMSKAEIDVILESNRQLYEQKWGNI